MKLVITTISLCLNQKFAQQIIGGELNLVVSLTAKLKSTKFLFTYTHTAILYQNVKFKSTSTFDTAHIIPATRASILRAIKDWVQDYWYKKSVALQCNIFTSGHAVNNPNAPLQPSCNLCVHPQGD